jgi:dTDP-4-dehydrorhamnose 3,5-epimerase-like enzyme
MTITPLELSGSDERGYTSEYYHSRFGQHLILFRKAGSVSGRHYHKGNSLTKNPEILIVLSGTCKVNWRNTAEAEMHSAMVNGPARLEIPIYTWHEIVAETDCTMLELNSISEHKNDTYYDG